MSIDRWQETEQSDHFKTKEGSWIKYTDFLDEIEKLKSQRDELLKIIDDLKIDVKELRRVFLSH